MPIRDRIRAVVKRLTAGRKGANSGPAVRVSPPPTPPASPPPPASPAPPGNRAPGGFSALRAAIANLNEPDEVTVQAPADSELVAEGEIDARTLAAFLQGLPAWQGHPPGEVVQAARALMGGNTATVVDFETGHVLTEGEEEATCVWLILAGSAGTFGYNVRVGIGRAGDFLGLTQAAAGVTTGILDMITREKGRAVRLPLAAVRAAITQPPVPWLPAILFADEARRLGAYMVGAEAQARNDQGVYFPAMRGQIVPGPYQGTGATLNIFLCKPPADRFKGLLPPGMTWFEGFNFFYFIAADMGDWHHANCDTDIKFTYHELSVMIPVTIEGKLRFYYPYILPDSLQAIFGGREVYGMPKLPGNSYIDDDPGRIVTRYGGETLVDLRYETIELWDADPTVLYGFIQEMFSRVRHEDRERRAQEPTTADLVADILSHLDNPVTAAAAIVLDRLPEGRVERALERKAIEGLVDLINATLKVSPGSGTLNAASWKRIPSPTGSLPASGRMKWSADIVDVDALFAFPFMVQRVSDLKILRLEAGGLRISKDLAGQEIKEGYPYGIRMKVDMRMDPGTQVRDYKVDFATTGVPDGYDDVMDWGPAVWTPREA